MTKQTTDSLYREMPAYLDAHCAAFNGWTLPTAKTEVEQQAIDRGHWDGSKARERALGA
jgi:hypothetical protein